MSDLDRAQQLIRNAVRLVIFTGAGVSADSGVPTFCGAAADALWGKFDPRQLASPEGFRADPKLVYDWYTGRRSQLAAILPNPAHHTIARWQERGAIIITQNVDGLHDRVGPPGAIVHRLHGTLAEDICSDCTHREPVDFSNPLPLRHCPDCRALLRPAVVWFGESLDSQVWAAAQRAARTSDIFLVIGTSAEVYPAAGLIELAAANDAKVVIVNLEPGPLDGVATIALYGRAAQLLPQLA